MLKRLINHWLSLCYICYGEKGGPEFFLVTFVSSAVITLNVFFYSLHWFLLGPAKTLLLSFHIANVLKGPFIIDFPFVTFVMLISRWIRKKPVTFVSYFKFWNGLFYHWLSLCYICYICYGGKRWPRIFFSLPLFLLESSLSVYFPFVTFVTLISTWTRKNPVTFVLYCKCWKGWFIIDFPFVTFVTGKKMAQNFFLVTFVSSGVITLSVFSICYFRHADFYMDHEKPVTFVSYCKCWKLTFPLLCLLHLLRGKRWPRIFSHFLITFVSSGVITLNVFSIRYFHYADF